MVVYPTRRHPRTRRDIARLADQNPSRLHGKVSSAPACLILLPGFARWAEPESLASLYQHYVSYARQKQSKKKAQLDEDREAMRRFRAGA